MCTQESKSSTEILNKRLVNSKMIDIKGVCGFKQTFD
jgi:hypothetical protein